VIISLYAHAIGSSTTLDSLFSRLKDVLTREASVGKELIALQGTLDLLMAAATTGSGETSAQDGGAAAGAGGSY
jgi:hypothetical protein